MNTKNNKANESNIALANLGIYYTWKIIKSKYNNNKFKIHAPTRNDEFSLPDGSCSISDIQDYFEYIIEKHETIVDNPSLQIYVNKIKNRIALWTRITVKRNNEIIRKFKKRHCSR